MPDILVNIQNETDNYIIHSRSSCEVLAVVKVTLILCHVLRFTINTTSNIGYHKLHRPVTRQQKLVAWQRYELVIFITSLVSWTVSCTQATINKYKPWK